ncbi:MAG: Uma2 family endonuclease [Verrucomicrobiota bacterium]
MKAMTWEDILEDRSLQDLPYKIETNRSNQIIMSPASAWHGNYEYEIGKMLGILLPQGKIINEAPVRTSEGVRVADVGWMSRERWEPHKRSTALPVAPEICVEILSPSNSREEMLAKMTLYYAKGAQEVWLCDEAGNMEFFTALSAPESVVQSGLCPGFPARIDVD